MKNETVIQVAEFNPKVCTYWLISGTVVFICSVVGIPLLIFWIPLARIFTQQYLDRMSCELTDTSLKVNKGIFVRIEKTIPLEKITDIGMVQGPIMRHFDLHQLTVETAGQSGTGALVSLVGIKDAKAFRELVLNQRGVVAGASAASPLSAGVSSPLPAGVSSPLSASGDALETAGSAVSPGAAEATGLLAEIRDSLQRIEASLEKRGE